MKHSNDFEPTYRRRSSFGPFLNAAFGPLASVLRGGFSGSMFSLKDRIQLQLVIKIQIETFIIHILYRARLKGGPQVW